MNFTCCFPDFWLGLNFNPSTLLIQLSRLAQSYANLIKIHANIFHILVQGLSNLIQLYNTLVIVNEPPSGSFILQINSILDLFLLKRLVDWCNKPIKNCQTVNCRPHFGSNLSSVYYSSYYCKAPKPRRCCRQRRQYRSEHNSWRVSHANATKNQNTNLQ